VNLVVLTCQLQWRQALVGNSALLLASTLCVGSRRGAGVPCCRWVGGRPVYDGCEFFFFSFFFFLLTYLGDRTSDARVISISGVARYREDVRSRMHSYLSFVKIVVGFKYVLKWSSILLSWSSKATVNSLTACLLCLGFPAAFAPVLRNVAENLFRGGAYSVMTGVKSSALLSSPLQLRL
jgi:hypothetical protein